MDDQDADPRHKSPLQEDGGPTNASNPLAGIVLCCTAVPPQIRNPLLEQALLLGAHHKDDLTADCTHLIVCSHDTPKYRYVARERPDIIVLPADFISAVRSLWIADKPISVSALEKQYALPPFAGLRVCLTGFEDPVERGELARLVVEGGGRYDGDLTKAVTHLVARRAEGSKYSHAKMWGLKVVGGEWIHACVERGMVLDEACFGLEVPVAERGVGAWNREVRIGAGRGKRKLMAETAVEEAGAGRRKLRRVGSSRTGGGENMWGEIVGSAPSVIQAARSGVWDSVQELPKIDGAGAGAAPAKEPQNLPLEAAGHDPKSTPATAAANPPPRGTFSDCRFYIYGFDPKKSSILHMHLSSHDAEISLTPAEYVSSSPKQLFLLVPHSLAETQLPDLPDVADSDQSIQTVTEWWIERCLELKSFLDPAEYTFGRPFPRFPIPEMRGLVACSSGFDGLQLLHLTKAVTLLGATYAESFSKAATVLIYNPAKAVRRDKLLSAREWGVPIVSLEWLLDTIERGARQRFQPYVPRPKRPRVDLSTIAVPVVVNDDHAGLRREDGWRAAANDKLDLKTSTFESSGGSNGSFGLQSVGGGGGGGGGERGPSGSGNGSGGNAKSRKSSSASASGTASTTTSSSRVVKMNNNRRQRPDPSAFDDEEDAGASAAAAALSTLAPEEEDEEETPTLRLSSVVITAAAGVPLAETSHNSHSVSPARRAAAAGGVVGAGGSSSDLSVHTSFEGATPSAFGGDDEQDQEEKQKRKGKEGEREKEREKNREIRSSRSTTRSKTPDPVTTTTAVTAAAAAAPRHSSRLGAKQPPNQQAKVQAQNPDQQLTSALHSLLANAKAIPAGAGAGGGGSGGAAGRPERKPRRILGRGLSIASNASGSAVAVTAGGGGGGVSGGGAEFSRATSVDSTATEGGAVIWPSKNGAVPEQEGHDELLGGGGGGGGGFAAGGEGIGGNGNSEKDDHDHDSLLLHPQTQISYSDTDAAAHMARIVAKMSGNSNRADRDDGGGDRGGVRDGVDRDDGSDGAGAATTISTTRESWDEKGRAKTVGALRELEALKKKEAAGARRRDAGAGDGVGGGGGAGARMTRLRDRLCGR